MIAIKQDKRHDRRTILYQIDVAIILAKFISGSLTPVAPMGQAG
ncbi:MAG: hypothetical protein OIF58_02015 [Cohaesibacter sp.]|nr:hypothetical protein [Cohaesibacter sp.]MCV6602186.1 hypothetical protein [Cohaesibacter sp.]